MNDAQLSTLILKNIMANMPGHVYWKNIQGVYLGCNDRQAKTLGFKFGHEVIGKTDFDLPWPEHSARQFHENDQRIMLSGIAEAIEEQIDEQGSTVFSIKSPIKNDAGEIFGILGISIDITDKKQAEALEKQKEIAEKNAEIMNILSGSIAHEIRTPLAVIKIHTDLLQMSAMVQEVSSEKKREFIHNINNIQQSIKECTQVIDMLLIKLRSMSSSQSRKTDWQTCSMSETIQATLSEYPFRKNEQQRVHYKKTSDNFCYQGNARLTKHVLFNLLKNALHIINQAQKGEIYIECKSGKEFNQLLFRDTAAGISKDYLPKIFDRFETKDDSRSGTGLGLAFCKLVMESYRGKIECCSELTKFTEFTLFFPVIG